MAQITAAKLGRCTIVRSRLKQIEMTNELIQEIEKEIAKIAVHDRRVDMLLGFCGIDYYGAMLLLY